MGNYYILSIDSFIDTFSLVETADTVHFSFASQRENGSLGVLETGDYIAVYRRSPVAKANIILTVQSAEDGEIEFQKLLEVAGGTDLAGIADGLEDNFLIQIDETDFYKINRELLMGMPLSRELLLEGIQNEASLAGILLDKVHVDGQAGDGQRDGVQTGGARVTGGENILLYGVPGVGKSHEIQEKYCSDSERIERVVFYPDYTYSDFVGQILPKAEKEQLKYLFTPGPFTRMLKKAWDNPGNSYYLIIEEMNRGNAPAIFGEIFQLLDRKDKDSHEYKEEEYGESKYEVSNYDVAEAVYGNGERKVRIPSNMWILATMNTADQNVFTLDTAFQRRWSMHYIKNDIYAAEHAACRIEGSNITWGDFASVINDMALGLNAGIASSEDKRLGAYFVKKSELSKDKFSEKVLKYLWDDVFKMERESVFQERFQSLDSVIDAFRGNEESGDDEKDSLKAVLQHEVYQKMSALRSGTSVV